MQIPKVREIPPGSTEPLLNLEVPSLLVLVWTGLKSPQLCHNPSSRELFRFPEVFFQLKISSLNPINTQAAHSGVPQMSSEGNQPIPSTSLSESATGHQGSELGWINELSTIFGPHSQFWLKSNGGWSGSCRAKLQEKRGGSSFQSRTRPTASSKRWLLAQHLLPCEDGKELCSSLPGAD